ncbi:MAG: HypC/HybG/HupF family hydrogenase formation chaperone [Deltaproteobacteria bacterium]|nr:HypC/HybG/HupF family hydrogenase formation chaperone [Deltaproteobacteria bacterium]MBN2670488.1 HypC/HybG/HupF family hydrogenase formation chaperone [Deltaproteobacteria bacterium]
MCLAVPMKLTAIDATGKGVSELEGTTYSVDLSLTPDAKAGDYLIVHAGFAIEKLDQEEADERLKLFEGMAQMYAEQDTAK